MITVVGRHFKNAHGLSCRMGVDTSVAAEYVSSSLVTCIAPVRGAGTVRVGVSNNGVDAGPSSKQLIFEAGRGISSVMPSKAPAHGGVQVRGRVIPESAPTVNLFNMISTLFMMFMLILNLQGKLLNSLKNVKFGWSYRHRDICLAVQWLLWSDLILLAIGCCANLVITQSSEPECNSSRQHLSSAHRPLRQMWVA